MRPFVLRPVTPDDARPVGLDIAHAIVSLPGSADRAPQTLAWVSGLNVLATAEGFLEALAGLGGTPLVLRTGWPPGADAPPAWLPGSRSAFDELALRLASAADATRASIWWWPCTTHVLSDVPSVLAFFRQHTSPRFGLLLDGMSLLTAGMMDRAEEHLTRTFEALGGHPAVRAVMLANLPPAGGIEGFALTGLTRGVVRPDVVRALWRSWCPRDVPVVLHEPGLDEQIALLERG